MTIQGQHMDALSCEMDGQMAKQESRPVKKAGKEYKQYLVY